MSPWVLLTAVSVVVGFTWLSNFFYGLRPYEEMTEEGQDEARKQGFAVGLLLAIIVVVIYVGATQPPTPYW